MKGVLVVENARRLNSLKRYACRNANLILFCNQQDRSSAPKIRAEIEDVLAIPAADTCQRVSGKTGEGIFEASGVFGFSSRG